MNPTDKQKAKPAMLSRETHGKVIACEINRATERIKEPHSLAPAAFFIIMAIIGLGVILRGVAV